MRVLMLITIAIALIAVASLPGTVAHEELTVRVTLGTGQTNATEILAMDNAEFTIWIYNGNGSDLDLQFELFIQLDRSSTIAADLHTDQILVEHRTEDSVGLIIMTGNGTELGIHVIPIYIRSQASNAVNETVQITVNVLDRPDAGLEVSVSPSKVVIEEGGQSYIYFNITNLYDGEREVIITTTVSNNLTDAFIEREHDLGGEETRSLYLLIYAESPGATVIRIDIVPISTPEFSEVQYVNVTVVEDLDGSERREGSSPSSPSLNAIWGFTIGCLIAMFATIVILRNRLPRH